MYGGFVMSEVKSRLTLAERLDAAGGWLLAILILASLAGAVLMVVGNIYYYVKLN